MHINCNDKNFSQEALKLAYNLYDFMKNKYKFTCEPKIYFISDNNNSHNILCKTGYYDPQEESVHVYVSNRHPKDVLRSLAHELLHHIQGCEGMVKADRGDMNGASDPNYFIHDKFLREIELDAFKRGNDAFREWEALIKQGDIQMSETKHKGKELKKFKEKRSEIAHAIHKDDPKMPMAKKMRIASAAAEKTLEETEEGWQEENLQEQKEVEVNEALKNSLYYVQEDRPLSQAYNMRDEKIYNELLKKFKIKK